MSGRECTCQYCGKKFLSRRLRAPAKTCSYRCMGLAKRTLPEPAPRPCAVCKTVFTPRRKYPQQFLCSKSCIWAYTKGPEYNAKIARETVPERSVHQRGVAKTTTPYRYRKLYAEHEHRVAAAKKLGRPLLPGEVVTHDLRVFPDRASFSRQQFLGKKQPPEQIQRRVESRAAAMQARKS